VAPPPIAVVTPPVAPVVVPPPVPVPPPAPVAVAPTPAPAPLPPGVYAGFDALEPDVATFLNGWVNDWQSRNAAAFFARYVPEFRGTSASRADWEAVLRPRIEGRRRIAVSIVDLRSRVVTPTEVRLIFRQVYESDAGNDIGLKAMYLVKRDGRWLIEREFFTATQ
jgi:hypothetical protein